MPTYDYRCPKCGKRFELFHAISDDTPKRCPKCKAKAVRVPSAGAGLLFKGSGFYITDYRSKTYKDRAKEDKAAGGTSSGESSGKSSGESSGKSSGKSSEGKSSGESSKAPAPKPAKPSKSESSS